MKKRFAFTLAEVLITLGIIGVVATLTIPILIQNYKKISYSTQLKKTYNTFLNALRLSEVKNGDMSTWEFPNNTVTNKDFVDNYIKPYMKSSKVVYTSPPNGKVQIYLNDGSSISFWTGAVYNIGLDINGDKKPNFGGKDIYGAYIINGKIENWRNVSRDIAKEKCREMARQNADWDGYCFLMLKYDNFEYKADYPLRL